MATNLLLEGEDLEALLARAHAEGGAQARIVRAEKVRRGGFLGFFARHAFEVAVEIPEPAGPDDDGDAVFAAVTRALADQPAPATAVPAPLAPELTPGWLAAEGLLATAGRVGAAGGPRHARSGSRVLAGPLAAYRDDDGPAPLVAGLPVGDDAIAARLLVARDDDGFVPHEPPADPVQPSTARPEFTALLDQLREAGAPAGRTLVAPIAREVPAPAPGPAPGAADDVATPDEAEAAPEPDIAAAEAPAPGEALQASPARAVDARLLADRRTLRGFGVPAAWTRRLRPGDRFGAVLRMLDRLPDPDIDLDAPVVAVVGGPESVLLEAHRTAIDLAPGRQPRAVVHVPVQRGPERDAALEQARRLPSVVVAVEVGGDDAADAERVRSTLRQIRAQVVIVVLDAARTGSQHAQWVTAVGRVDAVALDGAAQAAAPAAALALDLPVVRLDGIPVDRITWTALLCAQLEAADRGR